MLARLAFLALVFVAAPLGPEARQAGVRNDALERYVRGVEEPLVWEVVERSETATILRFTSQRWQGQAWRHRLELYEPTKLSSSRHVLLWVSGGSLPISPSSAGEPASPRERRSARALAEMSGLRTAVLRYVPNQPLLDGLVEDELIVESGARYLSSGDANWPLLFPMVASAVRAMDVLQAWLESETATGVESFVLTGASKRGWTCWLTAAIDGRVAGIAPLVIDILDVRDQMRGQRELWVRYSSQLDAYRERGLIVDGHESDREASLRRMLDPFEYRERLELPKLLVSATNDEHWLCDSIDRVRRELSGPTYVLQVPNEGHALGRGWSPAVRSVGVFARHVAEERELPRLSCNVDARAGGWKLRITSSVESREMKLWCASSSDGDFRDEVWKPRPVGEEGEVFLAGEEGQQSACYFEASFVTEGEVLYSLTTPVQRLLPSEEVVQGDIAPKIADEE